MQQAIITLVLFCLINGAFGQQRYRKRNVEVNCEGSAMTMNSLSTADKGKMKLDFRSLNNSPTRMRLMYFEKSTDGTSMLNLRMTFFELLEYVENGNDNVYTPNVDTIVSTKPIKFGNFDSPKSTTNGNGTMWQFRATSLNGAFTIVVTFADYDFHLNGFCYGSTDAKADFIITYNNTSSKSRIALASKVQSRFRMMQRLGSSQGVEIEETKGIARFGWSSNVDSNGQSVAVRATTMQNTPPDDNTGDPCAEGTEEANLMYFSFDREGATHFEWDPIFSFSAAGVAGIRVALLVLLALFASFML